ncbi:threonine ammonia-lyase [Phenylobacterium montanum]|uniref:Threonine/serine dehydratase n=1 Tax=Phenylobacterium montanum TaxID=2823693 RepID=A0A975G2J8_9CAUL|nr:threonine/serine dehydratase [Caulobacter sp. S6]QUD89960.1 threonine/serine dehydratase [Caulobacter sp. S6]
MTETLIPLADFEAARTRIAPYVNPTPLVAITPEGLRLKAESLHPIGAFKIRGAFNAILSLSDEERARGVIAFSSGNHAQAVSYAANRLGVKAVIVMPNNAPKAKLEGTRRWGAEVITVGGSSHERMLHAKAIQAEHGYALVPPYDLLTIMQGTGTIGLEILDQAPDALVVYTPVSGGGLLGGVSAAIKQARPGVKVIGVEPELANDAWQSFKAGHIVGLTAEETARTIADGLRVQQVGDLTWPHIRTYVDEIVTVTEAEIKAAMRLIATGAKLLAEPSGAVSTAGALKRGGDLTKAVAVLSGGNVDLDVLAGILAE